MNLSKNVKVTKVAAGAASAGTDVTGSAIDTTGWDGVLLFCTIATPNAGNYLKAQQDTASGMGAAADLTGSKVVATGAAQTVWLDIYRPTKRYIRGVVVRAGAATATGDMFAIQYKGRVKPQTNITTDVITGNLLISPAEGTP